MKLHPCITAFILLAFTTTSCSNHEKDNSATFDVTADVSLPATDTQSKSPETTPRSESTTDRDQEVNAPSSNSDSDSQPFLMGRRHATQLLQKCQTQEEIRDELLDINARANNIRCRIGAEAANDYLQGFRTQLKESGDTLASTLF